MPVSVRALAAFPPRLVGDGIADDTAAIQYLLDKGGLVSLNGIYRVTSTLQIAGDGVTFSGTNLLADHSDIFLSVTGSNHALIGLNIQTAEHRNLLGSLTYPDHSVAFPDIP